MGDHDETPQNVRAYLKRLGNPYASTQIDGFQDELAYEVVDSPRAVRRTPKSFSAASERTAEQRDLFAQALEPVDETQRSGNPYASLAHTEDKEQDNCAVSNGATVLPDFHKAAASKSEFESGSRRIFAQYIPALERGRLRPEHRDFIIRNKSRPAGVRFRLLQALRKYDLTQVSGIQPQFNRESEPLTIQKLREIESTVGEDE
jgi:hypothetical protein